MQKTTIYNARNMGRFPTLDREAFALVPHVSRVPNFYDAATIRNVYYPEVEGLLKDYTGATAALAFDHTVRGTGETKRGDVEIREPILDAHNDYTHRSGDVRIRQLLSTALAEKVLQHRYAVINVWRAIRGPLQTRPLAICDATSLKREDFVATDLVFTDRIGEYYGVAKSEQQRWFYFPDLEPDEALLFKCFDSDTGRSQFGAHGAFDDPLAPANALPRESIEARAYVFFCPPELAAGLSCRAIGLARSA